MMVSSVGVSGGATGDLSDQPTRLEERMASLRRFLNSLGLVRRGWLVPGLGLILATLLVAAACGGDGDDEGEADSTPSPQATSPSQATPTGGSGDEMPGGETPGGETPGGGTPGTDVSSELLSLGQQWASGSAKVTYELEFTEDGETQRGEMILTWQPPNWRMDMSGDITGGAGALTMITVDGDVYLCTSGQCLSLSGGPDDQAAPIPFAGFFADPDALVDQFLGDVPPGLDIGRSTRTIAGEEALCFSVSGTVEGETGESDLCFAQDGLMLLMSASFSGPEESGDFRFEATEVDRNVTSADFEPPYPVTDLPS